MLLKNIPAQSEVTFQTNYLGSMLILRTPIGTACAASVKIVPLGDGVLLDLDLNGVNSVGKTDMISESNRVETRILPLSDGLIPAKVVDITVNNKTDVVMAVYMPVFAKGSMYVQTMQQTILAASQSIFSDFEKIWLPDLVEADRMTIDFSDNASHTFSGTEIRYLSAMQQADSDVLIDNSDGTIKKVTVISENDSRAYLSRFMAVTNL